MSHLIGFKSYDEKATPKTILRDLNSFAYDPLETNGYHGNISFHTEKVCEDKSSAENFLRECVKKSYDDHAVKYKEGDKEKWLVRYEYHC